MKKLFVLLLSLTFIASVASAELLVTANPLGAGKWGFLGAALQDSDWMKPLASGMTLTTIGGYVGYGIMDNLDGFFEVAQGNAGNFPAGTPAGTTASVTAYGLNLKYTVLNEAPVSVAIGAGAKALVGKMTGSGDSNSTQINAGVGVSKIMAPFIPYCGVMYKSISGDSKATAIDATVGSAIAWSEQGAVFVEYTMQSITPDGVANYTSSQIGLGVGYHL